MARVTFQELPEDIVVLIFPYLRPRDFLALCRVNRQYYETFRLEPSYWREETRRTFRHPIHPLLQADGPRWQWLYKKLLTKTKVYSWGQGSQSTEPLTRLPRVGLLHGRRLHNSAWPIETYAEEDIGVVVDIQCGGWSTTLLNSDGLLFTAGKIDGMRAQSSGKLSRLEFPAAYPPTSQTRYEPSTAVKQFSSGRRHIIALSDSGKIWMWTDRKPAMQVKFLHADIVEGDLRSESKSGSVTKVAAGWEESSAYVSGVGIVYWNVFKNNEMTLSETDDTYTILFDVTTIPGTDFKRSRESARNNMGRDHEIGQVLNHIVLNEYIVFITDINKVFAVCTKSLSDFSEFDRTLTVHHNAVFELTTFSSRELELKDVQGAFEKFAVFAADGTVLMGNKALLYEFWSHQRRAIDHLPEPSILPALQSSNVISLAFGDYHMHALHANGRISSYGVEPQNCGTLGLGNRNVGVFRGIRTTRNQDGVLVPHSDHYPHYIWFDPLMLNWLHHLHGASLNVEAEARVHSITHDIMLQGEFSEWVEQEGMAWDDYPDIKARDPDGLGAYFALNVAAAGWRSCALVLVDQDLATQIRNKHVCGEQILPRNGSLMDNNEAEEHNPSIQYDFYNQVFPRLRLPSGFEMPGESEFNRWKYGMPPVRWRPDNH